MSFSFHSRIRASGALESDNGPEALP
ncbi:hypothetical protein KGM_215530 [Danaus plexippus plexippus]|uniref:Uncharacterized protein n=1 Tax=Danaus plexippus plexippus TaxID=278856 RepID=A0A212ERY1_DANPL|nr:hypothetical protein KGM_215530 [Danaus plexippus plexippus]